MMGFFFFCSEDKEGEESEDRYLPLQLRYSRLTQTLVRKMTRIVASSCLVGGVRTALVT